MQTPERHGQAQAGSGPGQGLDGPRLIGQAFTAHQIQKTYFALTRGHVLGEVVIKAADYHRHANVGGI